VRAGSATLVVEAVDEILRRYSSDRNDETFAPKRVEIARQNHRC
jgi:hypothetical protein